MSRAGSSFKRKKPTFIQQPLVLVICEDTKSCKDYLNEAKNYFRANALVEVVHVGHTDPKGIVEHAVAKQKSYDEVYCVIDRDTHTSFDAAVQQASAYDKVKLVISYPCFEFWLLLHFEYSRRTYRRAGNTSPATQMIRALKEKEGFSNYDKGSIASLFITLLPRLGVAIEHARRSLVDAENDREPNPSTQIHLLINRFHILGQPLKLS